MVAIKRVNSVYHANFLHRFRFSSMTIDRPIDRALESPLSIKCNLKDGGCEDDALLDKFLILLIVCWKLNYVLYLLSLVLTRWLPREIYSLFMERNILLRIKYNKRIFPLF